jgi:hypothetical protein
VDQADLPVVSSTMHPRVTDDKDKGGMVTSVKAMMSAKAGKNSEAEAPIQRSSTLSRSAVATLTFITRLITSLRLTL